MAKIEPGNGLVSRDSKAELRDNGTSSHGSDPETNGGVPWDKQADKYGFTGGAQQLRGES